MPGATLLLLLASAAGSVSQTIVRVTLVSLAVPVCGLGYEAL